MCRRCEGGVTKGIFLRPCFFEPYADDTNLDLHQSCPLKHPKSLHQSLRSMAFRFLITDNLPLKYYSKGVFMIVRKGPITKDDLCVFLNETIAKIIQNIGARSGGLESFDLNFNFRNSNYTITDKDIRFFRTRCKQGDKNND